MVNLKKLKKYLSYKSFDPHCWTHYNQPIYYIESEAENKPFWNAYRFVLKNPEYDLALGFIVLISELDDDYKFVPILTKHAFAVDRQNGSIIECTLKKTRKPKYKYFGRLTSLEHFNRITLQDHRKLIEYTSRLIYNRSEKYC